MWLPAIYLIWTVWGAVWLTTWLWAARTTKCASLAAQAPYRAVNLLGWIALFGDGLLHRTAAGTLRWQPFLPPLWRVTPAAGWALALLALAGLALAIAARVTLGRLWSAAVTRKEGHHIIEHGPYALVRHPIYTAILMGAIALALAKGTPIALMGLVLLIVGYTLKARVEERFLAAEVGEQSYAAYRRHVPMIVPFAPPRR